MWWNRFLLSRQWWRRWRWGHFGRWPLLLLARLLVNICWWYIGVSGGGSAWLIVGEELLAQSFLFLSKTQLMPFVFGRWLVVFVVYIIRFVWCLMRSSWCCCCWWWWCFKCINKCQFFVSFVNVVVEDDVVVLLLLVAFICCCFEWCLFAVSNNAAKTVWVVAFF